MLFFEQFADLDEIGRSWSPWPVSRTGEDRTKTIAPDSLLHALDGFTERWLFDRALLCGVREAQFVTNR